MVFLVCGCSPDDTGGGRREMTDLTEADQSRALALFQDQGCPVCHGDSAEGVDGVGEIRAKDIREGLRRLQELNLVDRYLQT